MGRRVEFVLGGKCPRGHLLTTKTLRQRVNRAGFYCLRCHADWNRLKYAKKKATAVHAPQ